MTNCSSCEGEKIASTCVVWEGMDFPFDSFNALIEAIYKAAFREEPKIDLKTLSTNTCTPENSLQTAVQLLIDKEVKNLHSSNSNVSTPSTTACNLNISSLDNCSTCNKSFCEKLQLMVNEITLLRAEVNQLKTQI